ncbi:MAG: hypothetical protein RL757_910 [Bacteroidota bacterium]|jgi:hypothetical protein
MKNETKKDEHLKIKKNEKYYLEKWFFFLEKMLILRRFWERTDFEKDGFPFSKIFF